MLSIIIFGTLFVLFQSCSFRELIVYTLSTPDLGHPFMEKSSLNQLSVMTKRNIFTHLLGCNVNSVIVPRSYIHLYRDSE